MEYRLGGDVQEHRRYIRISVLTPLLPLPDLRRVKGGYVPDVPGPGTPGFDQKPVFRFVHTHDFRHIVPPADRVDTVRITSAEHVLVIRTLDGPSFSPVSPDGTRDRAVVRINPVTRITPPSDAPILAVFRQDDPRLTFWRDLVSLGGGDQEEIISICETPYWRVLLIPSVPVRRALRALLADAVVTPSPPNGRGQGTRRRVL